MLALLFVTPARLLIKLLLIKHTILFPGLPLYDVQGDNIHRSCVLACRLRRRFVNPSAPGDDPSLITDHVRRGDSTL